jgi:hypothetical protein
VLGLIIAVLLPALVPRPKINSRRIKCASNLKNIGLAFQIFAADHQGRFPMAVSTNAGGSLESVEDGSPLRHLIALSNELSTPKLIVCPMDKKRIEATNFLQVQDKNVSYFVGVGAKLGLTNAFLSGDRNLTRNQRLLIPGLAELTTNSVVGWSSDIHNLMGNIGLVDGSVQQLSVPRLADALQDTGVGTNRLAVP